MIFNLQSNMLGTKDLKLPTGISTLFFGSCKPTFKPLCIIGHFYKGLLNLIFRMCKLVPEVLFQCFMTY